MPDLTREVSHGGCLVGNNRSSVRNRFGLYEMAERFVVVMKSGNSDGAKEP
jgi:hypothetical protein